MNKMARLSTTERQAGTQRKGEFHMNRKENSRCDAECAIAEARIRMEKTRRIKRRAVELAKNSGSPEHKRRAIQLSEIAEKAEKIYKEIADRRRDTGWQVLATVHGTRYHREIGRLQLDIERGSATWIASAVRDSELVRVLQGFETAEEAARMIEDFTRIEHADINGGER